ncbi:hypothetical protein GJ496_002338 [Pomphorhynchus laevis]|nr:hypothetical protein GJ496_002338 [Pomphorhynchus laevis]
MLVFLGALILACGPAHFIQGVPEIQLYKGGVGIQACRHESSCRMYYYLSAARDTNSELRLNGPVCAADGNETDPASFFRKKSLAPQNYLRTALGICPFRVSFENTARALTNRKPNEPLEGPSRGCSREAAVERLQSRGCSREAAVERLQSRGCSREAAVERLQSRGCSREAAVERLQSRGCSREAAVERLQSRGCSREAAVERLQSRGCSREAAVERLQSRGCSREAAVERLQSSCSRAAVEKASRERGCSREAAVHLRKWHLRNGFSVNGTYVILLSESLIVKCNMKLNMWFSLYSHVKHTMQNNSNSLNNCLAVSINNTELDINSQISQHNRYSNIKPDHNLQIVNVSTDLTEKYSWNHNEKFSYENLNQGDMGIVIKTRKLVLLIDWLTSICKVNTQLNNHNKNNVVYQNVYCVHQPSI